MKKNGISAEEYFAGKFRKELSSIDSSKTFSEQVETFLEAIGLSSVTDYKFVKEAFMASEKVDKVNYSNILPHMAEKFTISELMVKKKLVRAFSDWVKEENLYSSVSIMALIKTFAYHRKP